MSKRRLNKQQSRRILQGQQKFQQTALDNLREGLVITRFGRNAEIEAPDQTRYLCSIRPNIDSLVAGDQVRWLQESESDGVVVSCEHRQSSLHRQDQRGQIKVVAANVTQLVIVFAPEPTPSFLLIDTYLMLSELLHLKVILALNKADLPCQTLQKTMANIYTPLEYPLHLLQQHDRSTQENLRHLLKGQVTVIVGQSGVGKSSLISRLLPEEKHIQTAALSEQSKLGKHTTSHSRFYHLPGGGALIDSPGVREFNPVAHDRQSITYGFKDCAALAPYCRFRDCDHHSSPDCALVAALNEGKLHPQRYHSFCKLLASLERR
ncbi:MAG: ribosome small subunit-dependent GTPase A [Legionellaceae bacterium]|nr:ribosome small subunit-dependent GTPase A [Legionellaceae bacterium]